MTLIVNDGFEDLLPSDPYPMIPDEMKRERRWLTYRMEPRPDGGRNKIPYDPKTGRKANDPELGITYLEALAASKDYSGLGFYVESPYLCVDLDSCVNPETGDVTEEAADIIRGLNTYSELSPSNTGIHVWGKGVKPGTACRRDSMELYTEKRFITITGVQVPGTPSEVRHVDIAPIYARMIGENSGEIMQAPPSPPVKVATDVHQVGSATTSKLELLMRGEITSTKPFVVSDQFGNQVEYPSQSEADGALAVLLAFKYDGDPEKIDADFRVSTLYRAKWDRVDYRDITIKSAIAFYRKSKELEAPPNTPQVSVAANEDEDEIIDIDTRLPDFPEFTGSLANLCDAMSPDIPRAFKFTSAITHFGLIRSGLDTLVAEPHVQPRFYSVLVAQPNRGKSAAINETNKIMRGISNKYQLLSSVDSGPALVDALNDQLRNGIIKADGTDNLTEAVMAKILLSPDEIKGIFEKAKITTGSRNSMLDELLKLYGSNMTGNRARGIKSKIHIENAHLGLLGGATESGYASMWTGTGGSSEGLQSRVTVVGIDDRKMPSIQRPPDGEKLAVAIQKLSDQVKQPSAKFEIDNEAFVLYDKWWSAKDQTKPSETRIDDIIKRLLIVLARTNDVETINRDLMQQAIEFGDFVIACRDKYNPLDSSTWCQMQENLIIQIFQKHGNLTANQCRRAVHPERRPGGAGPFLQAFKNLTSTGILREAGSTQRAKIYRLSL
jgi:cytochrome c556